MHFKFFYSCLKLYELFMLKEKCCRFYFDLIAISSTFCLSKIGILISSNYSLSKNNNSLVLYLKHVSFQVQGRYKGAEGFITPPLQNKDRSFIYIQKKTSFPIAGFRKNGLKYIITHRQMLCFSNPYIFATICQIV